ncbi:MAG: hypothetical protein EBS31_00405 [Burkholderiaceae bacterium]|nr:hypothetical protein [Burkholderiaceae bacterium]
MAKMASLHADGVTDLSSYQAGIDFERERILNLRKQIINCVVDYGLAGEAYLRVMRELEELIKGEQN